MEGVCTMLKEHKVCIYRDFDNTCRSNDGCIFHARAMFKVEAWRLHIVKFVEDLSPEQRAFLKNWLGG